MPEQINASADLWVAVEADITGADTDKDASSSAKRSAQPHLAVATHNATLPTVASGTAGSLQIDSSGRLLVADGGGSLTIDGTVTANTGLSQPLTDTQLRAAAVPVSASTLPLPTGAATQTTLASLLTELQGKADLAETQPVSLASLPALAPGSNTIGAISNTAFVANAGTNLNTSALALESGGNLAGINTKLPAGLTVTSTRLLVDPSGVTQPISVSALPLPTGAATAANQSTLIGLLPAALGAQSAAGSLSIVPGTSTTFTVANAGTFAVQAAQSGTWTVTGAGGTFPVTDSDGSLTIDAPVGTPAFVRLSDGTNPISTLPVSLASLPADYNSGAAGASTLRSVLATRHEAAATPISVRLSNGSTFYTADGGGGGGSAVAGAAVIITPTLDTSAYAVGDVLFAQTTIAGATAEATGQGTIESITVVDGDDTAPAFTLVFFRDTITIAAANAAWNVSDADMAKAIGFVSFVAADYKDFGANRVATRQCYFRFSPASGTAIYCAAFADSVSTLTASGLTITVGIGRES
jgi:hypothetical protein